MREKLGSLAFAAALASARSCMRTENEVHEILDFRNPFGRKRFYFFYLMRVWREPSA